MIGYNDIYDLGGKTTADSCVMVKLEPYGTLELIDETLSQFLDRWVETLVVGGVSVRVTPSEEPPRLEHLFAFDNYEFITGPIPDKLDTNKVYVYLSYTYCGQKGNADNLSTLSDFVKQNLLEVITRIERLGAPRLPAQPPIGYQFTPLCQADRDRLHNLGCTFIQLYPSSTTPLFMGDIGRGFTFHQMLTVGAILNWTFKYLKWFYKHGTISASKYVTNKVIVDRICYDIQSVLDYLRCERVLAENFFDLKIEPRANGIVFSFQRLYTTDFIELHIIRNDPLILHAEFNTKFLQDILQAYSVKRLFGKDAVVMHDDGGVSWVKGI